MPRPFGPTKLLLVLLMAVAGSQASARTLPVGSGQQYTTVSAAAQIATPGDTILLMDATMAGGQVITNLHGTADLPIVIRPAAVEGYTTFTGGTNGIQCSDVSWLVLERLRFHAQRGNGLNVDDGGTYDTPTHHLEIRQCRFDSMDATGNNDLLKMSGIDDFVVADCTFERGAAGGSGLDMVGCHRGLIERCTFVEQGSNAIQAKGGTADITIRWSTFLHGGARAINAGGSTGLVYFRPLDASYEAARLHIHANVFYGGDAAVAFVGAVDCDAVNNTILYPSRWPFRILQETVDPERFAPCGRNVVVNNLVVTSSAVSTAINIGPDTDAPSFTFANNAWVNTDIPGTGAPSLPSVETGGLYGIDPQLPAAAPQEVRPAATSPLRGAGRIGAAPAHDIYGRAYAVPPSIGAAEVADVTSIDGVPMVSAASPRCRPVVLMASTAVAILATPGYAAAGVDVYDAAGRVVVTWTPGATTMLGPGWYLLCDREG